MAEITAHYSKAEELTLFLVSGVATAESLIAAIETHYGANPTSVAIWDLTRSDLSTLTPQDLVRVSDAASRYSQKRRNPRSLIVIRLEQEFYLIKLYTEISAVRGSPVSYELHYTLGKAYSALGIADPFIEHKHSA